MDGRRLVAVAFDFSAAFDGLKDVSKGLNVLLCPGEDRELSVQENGEGFLQQLFCY